MKILLDENIDIRFKNSFIEKHYAFTVKEMGWNGIRNGQLLRLLKEDNFDAWIVVDKNIPYQQNIKTLPCLVIVLDVFKNTLKHLQPLVPQVLEVLKKEADKKIVVIEEKI